MTDRKSGLKERMSDFGFEVIKPIKPATEKDEKKTAKIEGNKG